ncbi:hypothetical protein ABIC83_002844 [Roseateles asaccharophilus]|uniref:hypothetical protein n=1 Tax=Roseateles asaccharophilus TaxID=582607 RepID=UPI0038380E23
MHFRAQKFIACVVPLALAAGIATAQQPKPVPSTSIVGDAKEVRESVSLIGLPKELVVSGDTLYDSYFAGAETIRFKSGARLIFSDKALNVRKNFIVAAKTIVNEDQAKPGVITWARGNGPAASPPASGQAPGGPHGQSDGSSGGPGSNGAQGNPGIGGADAPNLTLFMVSASGAPPVIDLRGQAAGAGGAGQRGGDGGVGHKGSPASSSLFDCKSGAGYGGNGGPGGNGGQGGRGGTGGKGGTVTLVSLPTAFPALLQLVRSDVSGGDGGEGGPGGAGGSGGPGGEQGAKSEPYCKDEPGRRGANGPAGQPGGKGDKGGVGIQGDVMYTTLTQDAFNGIFGAK